MCEGKRVYTPFEVSKHCFQHDCWVIIDSKVYDVTSYIPRHPGGALIYVKAGGDCTQLFESYHFATQRARAVLQKYYVGELKQPAGSAGAHYEKQGEHDKFYAEIKKEVSAYFVESKLNPRFSISLYVKTATILLTVAVSAYVTFFGTFSYLVALAASVILGFVMAEVGTCIQHDANHGAFSTNPWICHIVGLTLDMCGASSFMWKQQHVVGHHVFTNVNSEDPDVRVKAARLTPMQPHAAHHALQHLYLGALYGLLTIKTILMNDFEAHASGNIGPVQISKLHDHEVVTLYAGKVAFACWFLVAPLIWSSWSVLQLAGLWTLSQVVTGWTLALMFQVAHVVDEVEFLEKDKNNVIAGSWAAQQLATTADFAHNSLFWTHISGGLNYQAVHHLFPGVNHTHYPALAPIIKSIADKHGVRYRVYPSFWAALSDHFNHLQKMGSLAITPTLHTIG